MRQVSSLFSAIISMSLLTTVTYAENFYVGANIGQASYDFEGTNSAQTWTATALTTRIGIQHDDIVTTEIRYGLDITGEKINGSEVKKNAMMGVFLKVGYNNNSRFYPYGVAGISRTTFSVDGHDDTDDNIALGAGVDVEIDQQYSVNLEYVQNMKSFQPQSGHRYNSSEASLGVLYHF